MHVKVGTTSPSRSQIALQIVRSLVFIYHNPSAIPFFESSEGVNNFRNINDYVDHWLQTITLQRYRPWITMYESQALTKRKTKIEDLVVPLCLLVKQDLYFRSAKEPVWNELIDLRISLFWATGNDYLDLTWTKYIYSDSWNAHS